MPIGLSLSFFIVSSIIIFDFVWLTGYLSAFQYTLNICMWYYQFMSIFFILWPNFGSYVSPQCLECYNRP